MKMMNRGILPDGSGFLIAEMPLPPNHWLLKPGELEQPPMPMRMGINNPQRRRMEKWLAAAGRYALRASIESPDEVGFDPDALIENLIIGMLGYFTEDGLSHLE